jgi:glycosyltransferase involved in cell wall biosynthesis
VSTVHVVLPAGTDDPLRPSGGHTYNRRVCRGLAESGWTVHERPVPGSWPWPDAADTQALAGTLAAVPDDAVVLIDGLLASTASAVAVPAARRLAVVVLVHTPLGEQFPGHQIADASRRESAMLSAARAVVTTSDWTRARLLERYALPPAAVHVATAGADRGRLAAGTAGGGGLLCVAAVGPHKGHDLLLAALAPLAGRAWRCRFVGPLDRDPAFVQRLRSQAAADSIAERVRLEGPLTGASLDRAYTAADVLVLASQAETYGMVVTEALAHGLPVVATAVGGVPEALGTTQDGRRPGLLVPPDDVDALSAALRRWLDDADLRRQLRAAARERRPALAEWPVTVARVASVLAAAAARPSAVGSGAA